MSLVEQALKKMQQARAPELRSAVERTTVPIEPAPTRVERPIAPRRTVRVNMDALRVAGFLAPLSQERQLATEYRHIKRPLMASALGRGGAKIDNGNLVMVTSALPGDGKTFTSINLALSMAAELDLSVVLVDIDVAKRHISRLLGMEGYPGLLDVVQDESRNIEESIVDTDIRGLSILPAGKYAQNATELLSSPRMEQVARGLGSASENRILLFDSPPLLLTSESRALASAMGQIILVVCAEATPQRAVFDALDMLGEGKPVSVILNQSEESSRGDYKYGYYGEQEASGAEKGA
jgi:protein-tyrosine kinase